MQQLKPGQKCTWSHLILHCYFSHLYTSKYLAVSSHSKTQLRVILWLYCKPSQTGVGNGNIDTRLCSVGETRAVVPLPAPLWLTLSWSIFKAPQSLGRVLGWEAPPVIQLLCEVSTPEGESTTASHGRLTWSELLIKWGEKGAFYFNQIKLALSSVCDHDTKVALGQKILRSLICSTAAIRFTGNTIINLLF